jgi:hypothetical protein
MSRTLDIIFYMRIYQVGQAGGPSEKQSMSRTLEWAAPPHYGGNVTSICFTATDAAGR